MKLQYTGPDEGTSSDEERAALAAIVRAAFNDAARFLSSMHSPGVSSAEQAMNARADALFGAGRWFFRVVAIGDDLHVATHRGESLADRDRAARTPPRLAIAPAAERSFLRPAQPSHDAHVRAARDLHPLALVRFHCGRRAYHVREDCSTGVSLWLARVATIAQAAIDTRDAVLVAIDLFVAILRVVLKAWASSPNLLELDERRADVEADPTVPDSVAARFALLDL